MERWSGPSGMIAVVVSNNPLSPDDRLTGIDGLSLVDTEVHACPGHRPAHRWSDQRPACGAPINLNDDYWNADVGNLEMHGKGPRCDALVSRLLGKVGLLRANQAKG
jgi:hypothetical protein